MGKRKNETKEEYNRRMRTVYLKRKQKANNTCADCGVLKSPRRNKTPYCRNCEGKGDRCKLNKLERTEEWKLNIAKAKLGNKNPQWKGDKVGMIALHNWVRRHKVKPKYCECCKLVEPYDLANISQKYKRDINDFEWLCRLCHMKKDKRIFNLKNCHEVT